MSQQKYTQVLCPSGYVPLQEASRDCDISRFTLYRWCRAGKKGVESKKIEGRWFISKTTVAKLKKGEEK